MGFLGLTYAQIAVPPLAARFSGPSPRVFSQVIDFCHFYFGSFPRQSRESPYGRPVYARPVESYSQSYPQILWTRTLRFWGNPLAAECDPGSRFLR
jgi:hypothetical protein